MGILDLIFPKTCVGCGRNGKYVCEGCEVGIWEEELICPICCRNSRYGVRHVTCKGSMEGLVCHFAYEGMVRTLITEAKYRYHYDKLAEIASICGKLSERPEYSKWKDFLNDMPVVVPVPLHPEREKERGFNQAEILAKLVARRMKFEVSNLLVRVKMTERQVGRNREERLKAMEGVFSISTKSKAPITKQVLNSNTQIPKNVLLVDDVWTTGATMRECADTLKKNGVEKVWGWVVAR